MEATDILDAIAPELAADPNKATHIDLADGQTGSVFGDQREHAVALLAAHTLTVAGRQGRAGGVSSLSEDRLSVGFGRVNPMGTSQLETTSYGAELIRLRRQYIMGARTRAV